MYCPKCGVTISLAGSFCGKCGKNVAYLKEKTDGQSSSNQTEDTQSGNSLQPSPPHKDQVAAGHQWFKKVYFCNYCGTAVFSKDNYCYNCGKKTRKQYYRSPGRRKKIAINIIILSIFIIVALVAYKLTNVIFH